MGGLGISRRELRIRHPNEYIMIEYSMIAEERGEENTLRAFFSVLLCDERTDDFDCTLAVLIRPLVDICEPSATDGAFANLLDTGQD